MPYYVQQAKKPNLAQLLGLFVTAITLPIWAGAAAAVIGSGFYLLVNFPIPFLVIGGGILLLATRN